ncbi:MAG: hypothetical protein UR96_C0041G0005 [candidate division WS6 bacterium GW2011_GWC1_36_11]|uniref:Uncharacterized protein n=2 Tax=Candidatus Dojkabacteria TaxID=74243 RepID=A0A0G0DNX8_9BACT|nr:MAG: hypothetical protein UR96_C0041G0005 [candidate division WS6 bacterium GW2011_GWC1_36_11]KKQ11192.1 MAG: hypothetical protein US24_C0038G0012 [candidate division WS6 bacterium GW2011_GWC2_36_7]
MSNKNRNKKIRTVPTNFISDYEEPKPSCINSVKNDPQEAMVKTVLGTLNLIEKQKTRKLQIPDEAINEGIIANADHLGITAADYREKMGMITDPRPIQNPSSEPSEESDSETSIETSEPRM